MNNAPLKPLASNTSTLTYRFVRRSELKGRSSDIDTVDLGVQDVSRQALAALVRTTHTQGLMLDVRPPFVPHQQLDTVWHSMQESDCLGYVRYVADDGETMVLQLPDKSEKEPVLQLLAQKGFPGTTFYSDFLAS